MCRDQEDERKTVPLIYARKPRQSSPMRDRLSFALSAIAFLIIALPVIDGLVWCSTITWVLPLTIREFYWDRGVPLTLLLAGATITVSFYSEHVWPKLVAWMVAVVALFYVIVIRHIIFWHL